jgi:AcrR family transcriptional regulator
MAATPKPRRTQEQRSAATRLRLLDATIECLWEVGYSATTTSEIARRAGVSRGAQLHHFPRKEELVISAVRHLFERRLAEFKKSFTPGQGDGSAAIDLLWPMFKGPTFYAWLELAVACRTDPALRGPLKALTESFGDDVKRTFRELFPKADPSPSRDLIPVFAFALMEGLALETIGGHPASEVEGVLGMLKALGAMILTSEPRHQ